MKRTAKTLTAVTMAALLGVPVYAAEAPSVPMQKMEIHNVHHMQDHTAEAANYRALEAIADRLEDLIDDMEDAVTSERKSAIQAKINDLIENNSEFSQFAADYTTMTKAELEAVEDKLDKLEDEYKAARKAAQNNGHHYGWENRGSGELPADGSAVPAEKLRPASDLKVLEAAVDKLEDLVDDMEDAKTSEEKAAIQAKINEIIEANSELSQFAADYTTMTKAELEAVEDKLDKLEDGYKAARKQNNGNHYGWENRGDGELPADGSAVPWEKVRPAKDNKVVDNAENYINDRVPVKPVEIAPEKTKEEIAGELEVLIKELNEAKTDEEVAAVKAKIARLVMPGVIKAGQVRPGEVVPQTKN